MQNLRDDLVELVGASLTATVVVMLIVLAAIAVITSVVPAIVRGDDGATEIDSLVQQLDSESYSEREQACRQLEGLDSKVAIPSLRLSRDATQSLEVRYRLQGVLFSHYNKLWSVQWPCLDCLPLHAKLPATSEDVPRTREQWIHQFLPSDYECPSYYDGTYEYRMQSLRRATYWMVVEFMENDADIDEVRLMLRRMTENDEFVADKRIYSCLFESLLMPH